MALRLRRGTNSERQLITPAPGELLYVTDYSSAGVSPLWIGDGSTVGGIEVSSAGGTGSTRLDALLDTDIVDPSNGDVLTWNSGTNKWEASVPGTGSLGLDDLSDVFIFRDPIRFDTLVYDGFSWTPRSITDFFNEQQDYKINIVGDDSTIIINTDTNDVTGNFFGNLEGNVTGDIVGSVFGDDSTVIVDAVNNRIYGDIYSGSTLLVDSVTKRVYADVNNAVTTSETINGGTLTLSGTNNVGVKAGIKILTDGGADDGYSLFDVVARSPGVAGQSFIFERGRGTFATPARLFLGDELMTMLWFGLDHDLTPAPTAAIRISVGGTTGPGIVPGKLELATADAAGDLVPGLTIGSDQVIDVADNTVAANSGSGTANVSGGVVSYLKIKVDGVERAIPLYGIVP